MVACIQTDGGDDALCANASSNTHPELKIGPCFEVDPHFDIELRIYGESRDVYVCPEAKGEFWLQSNRGVSSHAEIKLGRS